MPDWKTPIRQRLAPLRLSPAAESDLVEELAQHLEDRYAELRSGGAGEDEARAEAMSELDDMHPLVAGMRRSIVLPAHEPVPAGEPRRNSLIDDLWRDLRHAVRSIRKSPVFVLFVVVTLALGIGANTTIFTVINTLVLNPLPVRDPGGLGAVSGVDAGHKSTSTVPLPISYTDLKDYRTRNKVFRSLAGYSGSNLLTLQANGVSERIFAELATHDYFDVLGLRPARGRFFLPEEDGNPGAHPVAVMSYGTWQTRFGRREDVIGRTIRVNGIVLTVIGVGPPGFIGVNAIFGPDLWIPAAMAEALFPTELQGALTDRRKAIFTGVGRLKGGVTRREAEANLVTIAANLAREYPSADEGRAISVRPVRDILYWGNASPAAVLFASAVLLIVVGIVLLIACSNVANLLLARSAARRQEMAVRLAMGASRRRLIRQLLTESIVLGLMSGAAGFFVGYAGLEILFGNLPNAANFAKPKLDMNVFLFALVISVATGLVFGIVPAFHASRANVSEALKEETRTAGRSRRRISIANTLVVTQVAFSFLLLVTAALFLRSIQRAYEMDPGFQTTHLATFMTNPGQSGYGKAETTAFYKAARDRVSTVPGIVSAAWSSNLPLWARPVDGLEVEGRRQRSRSDKVRAIVNIIDNGYFETAGVTIKNGREFTDLDRENSAPVAIVNEKMAYDYWPGGAVGKRIQLPGETALREVVGIAKNANYTLWGEAPQDCVYVPLSQRFSDSMTMFVRTSGDPRGILRTVESEVRTVAPQVLVSYSRTGADLVDGGLFSARMGVGLLTVFGLLALGLASIGLYGILAYSVGQRRREIGVRMALGATRSSVLGLVLKQGISLVGTGVLIGLAAALLAGRLLGGMLYGVSAGDPLSVGAAAVVLCAVAMIACYLPALWATRVDPLTALREG
jgi:predicted permease